jgi:hypothetical protein
MDFEYNLRNRLEVFKLKGGSMQIKIGELDFIFLLNEVIGSVMLLGGIFWDVIAGANIAHKQGFGPLQAIWTFFWGMYILMNYYYQMHYGK